MKEALRRVMKELELLQRTAVTMATLVTLGACASSDSGRSGPVPELMASTQQALSADCLSKFLLQNKTWYAASTIDKSGTPFTGCVTTAGESITITADGDGVVFPQDPDPYEDTDGITFVYQRIPATTDRAGRSFPQDLEISARVTLPAGIIPNAQVGVMIRSSVDGRSLMGAGFFHARGDGYCDANEPDLGTMKAVARVPYPVTAGGAPQEFPYLMREALGRQRIDGSFWIRMLRIGRDFIVERSLDGSLWTPITLEGQPLMDAEALAGFFVSGWSPAQATATFDNIYVGPPRDKKLRTTWLGATYAKLSTSFASFGMHDIYVAPDGTTYKYGQATDPGNNMTVINPDGTIRKLFGGAGRKDPASNLGFYGFYQGGIAGDPDVDRGYVYLGTRAKATDACQAGSRVERRLAADLSPAGTLEFGPTPLGLIGGIATRNGAVYVSDVAVSEVVENTFCPPRLDLPPLPPSRNSLIRIAYPDLPRAPSQFEFTDGNEAPATPGSLAIDDASRIWIVQEATDYPVLDGFTSCENKTGGACTYPPGYCPRGGSDRCPCTQERSPYPGRFAAKRRGVIQCRNIDGSRCTAHTGRTLQITGANAGYGRGAGFNPVGITIDPGTNIQDPQDDALIVADNGPNQNILVCTNLNEPLFGPQCTPWGASGGVFSGTKPGLVYDANAGEWRRFFSPLKAARDRAGNMYVASSAPRVDIRKFSPGSSQPLQWSVFGLSPESGSFDPGTDGRDYYTMSRHHSFDPTKTQAGSEWAPYSVTWNPFGSTPPGDRYVDGLIPGGKSFLMRRMAGPGQATNKRYAYQIVDADHLRFYRFDDGEIAIPMGSLERHPIRDGNPCVYDTSDDFAGCLRIWRDLDQDGIEDKGPSADPCKPCEGVTGPCEFELRSTNDAPLLTRSMLPEVDQDGRIWLGFSGGGPGQPAAIYQLSPRWGVTPFPIYDLSSPPEWRFSSALGPPIETGALLPRYDAATDSMYILHSDYEASQPDCPAAGGPCWCYAPFNKLDRVLRYDSWHFSPVLSYARVLPKPQDYLDRPDEFMAHGADYQCQSCDTASHSYDGFDVAGGHFFVQRRNGEISVHDAATGVRVTKLRPGAEASGHQLPEEIGLPGNMRVFRRSDGEYLITQTDSSDLPRTVVLRWNPAR